MRFVFVRGEICVCGGSIDGSSWGGGVDRIDGSSDFGDSGGSSVYRSGRGGGSSVFMSTGVGVCCEASFVLREIGGEIFCDVLAVG